MQRFHVVVCPSGSIRTLSKQSLVGGDQATEYTHFSHQKARTPAVQAFHHLSSCSRSSVGSGIQQLPAFRGLSANQRPRLVPMTSAQEAVATAMDAAATTATMDGRGGSKEVQINGSDPGAGAPAGRTAGNIIDFLSIVTRLKEQKRTGWILRKVEGPESIADHMYRMSVMALLMVDHPGINRDRCIKIAIAHDIAEAIAGDIAPADGVSKEEKRRREAAAMDDMCGVLGGPAAREVRELWEEYEANATPEAKLVKDLDKVEMILQAYEYEQAQGLRLQDFFDSTKGKFQTDIGKAWAAEIVARRQAKSSESSNEHEGATSGN